MAEIKQTYQELCDHVRETAMVESIRSVLGWDEQTYMPPQAGDYRAEQITWLAAASHRRRTDPQVGEWLAACEDSELGEDSHGDTATVIRELRRDYQKRSKLPQSLVEELARATVLGQQAWVQARKDDDFASFSPVLTQIIDLKRQQAEAVGYEDSPYDVLLDDYEPGETTANVATGPRLILVDLHQSEPSEHVEHRAENGEQLHVRPTLPDKACDVRLQRAGEPRHGLKSGRSGSAAQDLLDRGLIQRRFSREPPLREAPLLHHRREVGAKRHVDSLAAHVPSSGRPLSLRTAASRFWRAALPSQPPATVNRVFILCIISP